MISTAWCNAIVEHSSIAALCRKTWAVTRFCHEGQRSSSGRDMFSQQILDSIAREGHVHVLGNYKGVEKVIRISRAHSLDTYARSAATESLPVVACSGIFRRFPVHRTCATGFGVGAQDDTAKTEPIGSPVCTARSSVKVRSLSSFKRESSLVARVTRTPRTSAGSSSRYRRCTSLDACIFGAMLATVQTVICSPARAPWMMPTGRRSSRHFRLQVRVRYLASLRRSW